MTRAAAQRSETRSPAGTAAPSWRYDAAQGVEALRGQEWVLTNGLGGFAMGTAAGIPTRRYHALLIGATRPPVGRIAALNAVVEEVEIDGRTFGFASFEFNGRPDPVVHPRGVHQLAGFECGTAAKWTYAAGGFTLAREVRMCERANGVLLRYSIQRDGAASRSALSLKVRPLVSLRDFHEVIRRAWAGDFRVQPRQRGVRVERAGNALHMEALTAGAAFVHEEQWWYDFFYREDAERGQECVEDLFSPGQFEIPIPAGPKHVAVEFAARLGDTEESSGRTWQEEGEARERRIAVLVSAAAPASAPGSIAGPISALAAATDAFVVARRDPVAKERKAGPAAVSTIAGYPWFSDWGRDTFISMEGLLLTTGRFDEARHELECFATARRNGIIPNVFNDRTGEPEFNTVDASLWFIHAACRWLEVTGDRAGFAPVLRDACLDVVQHYRRGTDFNIAMDPIDKLITAGTSATQLTWMDARRDGVTFTPRHGKAVEINALWHHALRSLAAAMESSHGMLAADLNDLAAAAGRSLAAKFWNPERRCLLDCLTPGEGAAWIPDASVRPNQIFAASLRHSALTLDQRRSVIECVKSRLLTPMGLRTLDPADPRYRGRYRGTLFERDGAYHQGTAWPWLLGPLAEAVLRAGEFSPDAKREAMSILGPILGTLAPGDAAARAGTCAGQIAEVYDGDSLAPQHAGGCPAQAWSVAEALRVARMIVS